MGIDCGTQVILCDIPIHLDTYEGCSHACKYCFVKRKHGIAVVNPKHCKKQLLNFINGSRTTKTEWCDWKIPLHWGAMSDPFQPAESRHKASLELLEVFAETKYPFVVSSKGRLAITEPYLSLFRKCNCVYQISAICQKLDKIEEGAPSFEERLHICDVISKAVPRVIIRIQPYFRECKQDVLKNLQRFKDAGAYGVVIESMKYTYKKPGLVKIGADFTYPIDLLKRDFQDIKNQAHAVGLRFFVGENRLRKMGDSFCCCGIEGLKGFKGNDFNLSHLMNGDNVCPTENMKRCGGRAFTSLFQESIMYDFCKNHTFEYMMRYYGKKPFVKDVLTERK